MADLTTTANVKAYLGSSNSNDDALLGSLVSRVSQYIKSWLNRDLESKSYSETVNGHGGVALVLPNYPVTAVSSVVIDGQVIPAAPDSVSSGYRFNDEMIVLNGYVFTKGMLNVSVSYTAGFSPIPADIEQACIELVALIYRGRDRIGLSSKGMSGEQTNFITKEMPDSIKSLLNQYRKVVPV